MTHVRTSPYYPQSNGKIERWHTWRIFGSLLKRGLKGTYVSVEPFHLFRYLDEQGFRYNNRKMTDADRLDVAVRDIAGASHMTS